MIEDTVQASLVQALQSWPARGIPDDPAAWIFRVAKNKVLDALRREETAQRLAPTIAQTRANLFSRSHELDELFVETEIEDSQLRMIFACSHPSLPIESSIPLVLKTLCGFSRSEIARGLLIQEETAKKRITRAKRMLAERDVLLEMPTAEELPERLETVHTVLYLMFNEGYSSTSSDAGIRKDLCEEAARLCYLLCSHPKGSSSSTYAMMALMLFHAARFDARLDRDGMLLLSEEQDRSKWDGALIGKGLEFLKRSMQGATISRYHLEAGIAMYHCKAANFADTDWQAILMQYDLLIQLQRSPVFLLNRAIALAYVKGPAAGIQAVREIEDHPQLQQYHLLDCTLGELYYRSDQFEKAREHFQTALNKAHSNADRQLIKRKLAKIKM